MTDGLKPCPCCGSGVLRWEETATDGSVRCMDCGLSMAREHLPRRTDGKFRAAAYWNTRTPVATAIREAVEAARAEERERARVMREALEKIARGRYDGFEVLPMPAKQAKAIAAAAIRNGEGEGG